MAPEIEFPKKELFENVTALIFGLDRSNAEDQKIIEECDREFAQRVSDSTNMVKQEISDQKLIMKLHKKLIDPETNPLSCVG